MTTTRTVSLAELHLEHKLFKNPRLFTGMGAELEDLAESIKAEGIIDPPKVIKVKSNGSFINLTVDGQRRVLAGTKALGKGAMIEVIDLYPEPVDLTPELADDLLGKALASLKREGLSSFELAEVAIRMRDRDTTLAVIAAKIGKSEGWVSKILAARKFATPKLMHSWQRGEITDEQFKDLAAEKAPDKQDVKTDKVVETRKSGDKAEARTVTKEIKETAAEKAKRAKAEKAEELAAAKQAKIQAKADKVRGKAEAKAAKQAAKAAKKNGVPPVVGGPQVPLTFTAPPRTAAEPAKKPEKRAPSKVMLEELASLRHKRPPTHDYVKGFIEGIRVALGEIDLHDLGKPWAAYMSRVGGTTVAKATKATKATAKPRSPGHRVVAKPKAPKALKTKGKPARKAKSSAGKRKR